MEMNTCLDLKSNFVINMKRHQHFIESCYILLIATFLKIILQR